MYMFIIKHMILYSDCIVKLLAYALFFSFFVLFLYHAGPLLICAFAFSFFFAFPFCFNPAPFFHMTGKNPIISGTK